ncbi:MAG TPA: class I SAM-dependent methyltransferase [Blastocatellia bacterium]|nr:class I SAM-dependent methyltransferase [Blastocatellia bacterium]
MRRTLTGIAKTVLRLLPAYPAPDYLPLDQLTTAIAVARAREEMEDERTGGFLKFFNGRKEITGDRILDLGCGFGGRTAEFQRRTGALVVGLEINQRMAAGALKFTDSIGVKDAAFVTGVGEALPFADDSFDVILSYDVLEHVEDPRWCLSECKRTLKPGGVFLLVFPPYYHPTGAHLEGYVSRIPYANLLFPSSILLRAIDEILEERGGGYRPQPLRPSDRLYSLNGLTVRAFKRILKESGFEVASLEFLPLFSRVNRNYDAWKMKYYAWIFKSLSRIPLAQECFTHRVVAVLRKPDTSAN